MIDCLSLPQLLKQVGEAMSREKRQRPEVFAYGKRSKLWRAEYRVYFIGLDGKEHSRHTSKTWPRATYTKAQAQAALDAIIRGLSSGPPVADGSITLAQFWQSVFRPIRSRHWQLNTTRAFDTTWNLYVNPQLGQTPLRSISKSTVELHLGKLADEGRGFSTIRGALGLISSLLLEAQDNDLIAKNPARKIRIPQCREQVQVRSLTLEEVRLLFESTVGRDYLMWRLLLLTGLRKGELLALARSDIQGDRLCIDETVEGSGTREGTKGTKKGQRRKVRYAPLVASLKAEIDGWLAGHDSQLLFPNLDGKAYPINSGCIAEVMNRGKQIIPGLTFRQCRTTFATLFEGDIKDVQAILGHATAQFTADRYKREISERQRDSVEALDRRVRKVVEIKKAG